MDRDMGAAERSSKCEAKLCVLIRNLKKHIKKWKDVSIDQSFSYGWKNNAPMDQSLHSRLELFVKLKISLVIIKNELI